MIERFYIVKKTKIWHIIREKTTVRDTLQEIINTCRRLSLRM